MQNMKIVSWNVNSIRLRAEAVSSWLKENSPDILMLQELKCEEKNFPYEAFEHLGYNIKLIGQKTFNGVAIFSKYPIEDLVTELPNNPLPEQARFIEISCVTPLGFLRAVNLYIPNGGEVDSDKYQSKMKFYDALLEYLNSIKSRDELLVIGGDFNVAPEAIDVYNPEALDGTTCFTKRERDKLYNILNAGFIETYRFCNPGKSEFSWWDYRAGAFAHNKGMRIDHILTSPLASNYIDKAYIDANERAKEKPSDHAPVILELKGR